MGIVCERCDKDMHTVFYEGIAIQLCKSCKSVFLTQKKLEIIENNNEIKFHSYACNFTGHARVIRHCPNCKIAMRKMKYGYLQKTMIDFCTDCHGIWLGESGLDSIQFSYEIAEKNRFLNYLY